MYKYHLLQGGLLEKKKTWAITSDKVIFPAIIHYSPLPPACKFPRHIKKFQGEKHSVTRTHTSLSSTYGDQQIVSRKLFPGLRHMCSLWMISKSPKKKCKVTEDPTYISQL